MNRRAGRAVLLGVVALHLIADNALSPFYPQLFAELFGVTDLAATGTYIWLCRFAALVALPLWGLAARRWPLHHLVVAGLVVSAALDLALAFAPGYLSFTVISVALVTTTMSMALAYPALIALGDAHDRLPQVRAFAYVTYAATVAATLIGGGIMALPDVRWGIGAFAVVDLLLAWCCHRILGRGSAPAQRLANSGGAAASAGTVPAPSAPSGAERPARSRAPLVAVALVAGVVLTAEIGRSVVRPFFTAYAENAGLSAAAAAVLFLLPALAALAVLPLAGLARRRLGPALLPAAFLTAAVGLVIQATAPEVTSLALGRLVFGAGLGLGQIALDLRVFAVVRSSGPAFTAVETARSVALLASPLAATVAAEAALAAPLLVGAAVFVALAVLVAALGRAPRRPGPTPAGAPTVEEIRVPDPAR